MGPEQQVEKWSDGVLNIESVSSIVEGGTRIRYRVSQCAKPPPGNYLKDVDLRDCCLTHLRVPMETWTREQVAQEFVAWAQEIARTTGIKEHAKQARVYVIEILAILYLANDLPSFRPIRGSVRHDVMLRYFGLIQDYMKPRVEKPLEIPDALELNQLELIERDMNSLSLVDQHQ